MIDPAGVAKVKRVDDLDEYTLDQLVLSEESKLPDEGVEIASAEIIDKEGVVARIDLTMECEYVGVGRNPRMELGFAGLIMVGVCLLYTLDGIVCSRSGVNRAINNAKSPRTQDRLNPEYTVVDGLAQKLGRKRRVWHWKSRLKGNNQVQRNQDSVV